MERDCWMFQVASASIAESKEYRGSLTSVGGKSLLSLVGTTEQLSQHVDINVAFVGAADACKPNWGTRLIGGGPSPSRVKLGITSSHEPNGGGNFLPTACYPCPSVLPLPGEDQPEIKSDQGLRDAPRERLMETEAMPLHGASGEEPEPASLTAGAE